MKKNKSIWIWLMVFVVVIAGAAVLYQKLGSQMQMDTLVASGEKDISPEDGESVPVEEKNETEQETSEKETSGEEDADTADYKVPDFTVEDGDGKKVKLSDFMGKPIVLNFWASWCGPCQSEMPDFEEIYQEYGENVHFLMVNMTDGSRETVEGAKAFVEENGYTFPVYFDTTSEAAIKYGVRAIPTTYFIDEEGNGIAQAMSALDKETIQKGLDMIL